jgi:flagellar hook-associated protein 1 FlgK
MGLTQALNTAVGGLRITQAGLSLVAGNVSNAETPGYIRKTLNLVTGAAGNAGVGVRTAGINRELDQFLQRQLRMESSGGAYADLKAQFYQRLQQVYGTPGSASSLETIYSSFTTALQALSTSPDDYSARANVLGAAQVLAQQLNGLTAAIQGLRSDAESGLADAVRSANDAMQAIAQINRQLATAQSNDIASATLLDQRDQYLNQLSLLMDIRVSKDDFNQVTVFTASGIQLVGTEAARLNFDAHGMITANAQWSGDPAQRNVGTITLVLPTGGGMDLVASKSIRSGEIAALLELRDQVLVQAQAQLDDLAAGIAGALSDRTTAGTPAVSGARAGFDLDIASLIEGNTIEIGYTDTTTNTQRIIRVVRVDDPTALPLPPSGEPNVEVVGIDFSAGVGAVASQLNARFNGKPLFANPSGTILQVLDDGAPGLLNIDSVSATSTLTALSGGTAQLPFFLDAGKPYSGVISGMGRQITGLAGRIAVNAALLADPSKLVSYQPGTPSGDATRPNFLYAQLTGAAFTFSPASGIGTAASPYRGTLPSFVRQILSQQGEAAAAAIQLAEGQSMVVQALQQRFNDEAGVNIDEEMTSLLTLQNAYAANARILTTVKEMFDVLMQM